MDPFITIPVLGSGVAAVHWLYRRSKVAIAEENRLVDFYIERLDQEKLRKAVTYNNLKRYLIGSIMAQGSNYYPGGAVADAVDRAIVQLRNASFTSNFEKRKFLLLRYANDIRVALIRSTDKSRGRPPQMSYYLQLIYDIC